MRSKTETINISSMGLDTKPTQDILGLLHDGQVAAAKCVQKAIPEIEAAALVASKSLLNNGRLVYAAAGSSGLMALSDGLELPGSFGISHERIKILLAGGEASLVRMQGNPDDDVEQAKRMVHELNLASNDCVICISASGSTPYTLSALKAAKKYGASTIAIANNPNTPLLEKADIAIYLPTPVELIAGSTRLGAGTAQKIALNLISTSMAVHLGHVLDGHMVNVQADNEKLKARAQNMITIITGCKADKAARALEQSGGSVKLAIILAVGAKDLSFAQELLSKHEGRLRTSLAALKSSLGSS